MSKLLVALIIGAFAGAAAGQTAAPKMTTTEKQQATQATTQAGSTGATGAATAKQQEVNVKRSKETAKMSTADKNAAIKDVNTKMVNPDNTAGVGATSRTQQQTTAASKGTPKPRPNLNTPEAQKAMQKAATP
jgi:type II secretory pathway pseudopilin PulG